MADLYDFQERVPTTSLVVGDFLYQVDPAKLRGPRGGRYRWDGVKVDSGILRLEPTGRGLKVVPKTGPAFTLPGNLAQLTTCVIKARA